jgi:acetyl-CoA carboxylase biotin carboxylase subunit
VPIEYDPLLAKLIGYGGDRRQAISRLTRALSEYFVGGIKTNLSLFRRILSDADFQEGRLDTGYLDRLLQTTPPANQEDSRVAAIAAGVFAVLDARSGGVSAGNGTGTTASQAAVSAWKKTARTEALG